MLNGEILHAGISVCWNYKIHGITMQLVNHPIFFPLNEEKIKFITFKRRSAHTCTYLFLTGRKYQLRIWTS